MTSRGISVVIPSYNRAHCLPLAIDSALDQGHDPLEVLVIDDGSTDRTRTLVEERYGQDPRVKYTYQPNQGVAAARNEGLRQAQGEFIAFLDSDDVWLPGKLRLQLACLDAVPEAGMVWTDMEAVDVNHRPFHPRYLRVMYHAYRNFSRYQDLFSAERGVFVSPSEVRVYSGDIFSQMVLGSLVHTSTVLLRRERARRAGFFREDFRRAGEDFDFHLRVCREGPVAFADAVTIRYQVGAPDAITRPELQSDIARAYLVTLQETLARDRPRIDLPDSMITRCLAGAYASVGRAEYDAGRAPEARSMYWRSLRLRPFEWESLKILAVAALPGPVRTALRSVVRTARAWRTTARLATLQAVVAVGPTVAEL